MKTIRHSAFETNSSSTHSISINENTKLFSNIRPDKDGKIVLDGGEFGWEWDSYSDPYTKANYCMLDNQGDEPSLAMLREVIMEHTGATEVIFNFNGYIDHQSLGTTDKAFASKETLKAFIFDENSILNTGNDNS